MSIPRVWTVLLPIAAILVTVGWVGWRFFYLAPRPPAGPPAEPGLLPPHGAATRQPWRLLDHGVVRWSLSSVLVAGAIVGLTLPFATNQVLPPPPPEVHPHSERIQLSLEGDRLVPPPPLPPSAFITSDEPSLASADRDWNKLEPSFAQRVVALMERMHQRGYPLALIEGYRSPDRQNSIAASGRGLTRAAAFESKHQFGLAADLAPVRDGRIVLSERDPWAWEAYQVLGEESEAAGLTWGGRWTLQDYGHVETKDVVAGRTGVANAQIR